MSKTITILNRDEVVLWWERMYPESHNDERWLETPLHKYIISLIGHANYNWEY